MTTPLPDFENILQILVNHQVDFIVVGGVSAVLQGAPIATFDLDVVHSREPANLDRLLAALQDLQAYYREQASRRLTPTPSHLASPGHQLLMTTAGSLDLLGTIGSGHGYAELVQHTIEILLWEGIPVRVLDLATLITIKEETAREKDKAVLPILRRTLEEKSKG